MYKVRDKFPVRGLFSYINQHVTNFQQVEEAFSPSKKHKNVLKDVLCRFCLQGRVCTKVIT